MFPEGWTGYALIHVPLLGKLTWVPLEGNWFPGAFSFCWLGGNAAAGFWIAWRPGARFLNRPPPSAMTVWETRFIPYR